MPRTQQDAARHASRHEGPPLLVRRGPVAENAVLPATGGSLILASAAANTFTAWTAIGTTVNAFIPSQVKISTSTIATTTSLFIVELAWGPANQQYQLEAFRFPGVISDPTADASGFFCQTEWLRPRLIPAGMTIYARARQTATVTLNYEILLLGWDNTYPDLAPLPSHYVNGTGRWYPSNTDGGSVSVVPAVWGIWGAWKQFQGAVPNDLLVTAVMGGPSLGVVGTASHMTQVGVGPAGAESPAATIIWAHEYPVAIQHPVWVKAGERLSLRAQGDSTSGKVMEIHVVDVN